MSTKTATVRRSVRAHIEATAGPCKRWYKPKYVADAVDASPTLIGRALTAMYEDDDCALIVERRSGTSSYVYRVADGVGGGDGA